MEQLRMQQAILRARPETARIMDMLKTRRDIRIEESSVTLEEFPPTEDFSGFEALPASIQKTLRRLALCCELYLTGFIMTDERTTEDRDQWEREMQEQFADDFNSLYAWSKFRLNAMTKVITPLLSVTDAIKEAEEDSPKLRTMLSLDGRIPANLMPPFQKAVYYPELDLTKVEPMQRYNLLSLPEKREVVNQMEDIALDFLELVTSSENKSALHATT